MIARVRTKENFCLKIKSFIVCPNPCATCYMEIYTYKIICVTCEVNRTLVLYDMFCECPLGLYDDGNSSDCKCNF